MRKGPFHFTGHLSGRESGLRVCWGVGISAFIHIDLFFFSLVIVRKQNKTSCKLFGTSGNVLLLRTVESENSGEQSWKPPLHCPVFPGVCLGARVSQEAVREREAIRGRSAK